MKKKLLVSLSALILTAALVLTAVVSPASVTALNANSIGVTGANTEFDFEKAGYEKAIDMLLAEEGFIYGIDYNFSSDLMTSCYDLGDNYIGGQKATFSENNVRRDFYNIKALGFNTTNWWLMMHLQGVKFDDDGLATGLGDNYLANMRKMLEIARETGLKVIPTISNHDLLGLSSGLDFGGYEGQMKYVRFQWDPVAQDAWFKNVIDPICELLADYQDVIPSIGIGVENMSGWVDDYDLGFFQYGKNGTTLELYGGFYNRLVASVRKTMPTMPTAIEMGGSYLSVKTWARYWERLFLQNELDVDFISQNYYHSGGGMDNRDQAFITRPGYVGEFDVGEGGANSNVTEEVYMAKQHSAYHNARKTGWFGASMYIFYPSRVTLGGTGSLNNYETFRPFLTNWGYDIQDQINTFKGITNPGHEVAKPLFYQGGQNVYWIPARNTKAIDIERTKDGGATWQKLATNVDYVKLVLPNGLGKYVDETTVSGETYAYRVTSHFEGGQSTTSIATNEALYYIPPNVVKDGGFESGAFHSDEADGFKAFCEAGWTVTDEEAYEGTYSAKLNSPKCGGGYCTIRTAIETKPATTYNLTCYIKSSWIGDEQYVPRESYNEPCSVCYCDLSQGGATIFATFYSKTDGWSKMNLSVNTADYTNVGIKLMSGTKNHQVVAYVDAFDCREVR